MIHEAWGLSEIGFEVIADFTGEVAVRKRLPMCLLKLLTDPIDDFPKTNRRRYGFGDGTVPEKHRADATAI